MLSQFHSYYPQGSLLSELITIDRGHYIVRAVIQVKGVTLATSLAAASTIEAAEDKARNRALSLLNFSSTPNPQETTPASATTSHPSSSPSHHPLSDRVTRTAREDLFELSQPQVVPTSELQTSPTEESQPTLFESYSNSETSTATTEIHPTESTDQRDVTPKTETAKTTNIQASIPSDPIDFSEIIAQTNVEMKRLNWTSEQGRDYLLQTYGKRSRQLLSDEELLEFLHYLKAQPLPG